MFATGCNRNRQDAILRANEADKIRKVDREGAIAKLEEATRLDPANHRIWYKLSAVYREKEDWPKMAEALQNAIAADEKTKDDGTWATYYAERGYAIEQQAKKDKTKYEDAKAPYLKCIEVDPNYADCYHQLGNVYLWTDDEQKALEYYTKAIEHDPKDLRYYAPLADLYIALGYMKEAEAVLKEAKGQAAPNDKLLWGVHARMADVLLDRGDLQGAVSELEQAKAINVGEGAPEAVLILYSLGGVYADLNRGQEAKELLKGFYLRACRGARAKDFPNECEIAKQRVVALGGTLQ
jgi:tetratricopeptide (TPR) repeat protein